MVRVSAVSVQYAFSQETFLSCPCHGRCRIVYLSLFPGEKCLRCCRPSSVAVPNSHCPLRFRLVRQPSPYPSHSLSTAGQIFFPMPCNKGFMLVTALTVCVSCWRRRSGETRKHNGMRPPPLRSGCMYGVDVSAENRRGCHLPGSERGLPTLSDWPSRCQLTFMPTLGVPTWLAQLSPWDFARPIHAILHIRY